MRQIGSMQKVVITFAFGKRRLAVQRGKGFDENPRRGALGKAHAAAF
jgi:hypothetical protein